MSPRSFRRAHARRIARDERRAALRRRRQIAAAGVIGAAALMAPTAAQAYVVTQKTDGPADACDSNCTLRDAVTAANLNPGADAITFASNVTGTIRLTSGELSINVDEGLTITGPGRDVLTVSGDANNDSTPNAGDSRIFAITANGTTPIDISGLTLTNGFDPAGGTFGGGAIYRNGAAPLHLAGVAITHSASEESGGAIAAVNSGDLTIESSTISGNVAKSGGGVNHGGNSTLTVRDSTISDNHATGSPGSQGGGIAGAGGQLDLQRSTLSGNTSDGAGGGIWGQEKYGLSVASSTISGNSAVRGGGIELAFTNFPKYMSLTESTVSGNQATFGAGLEIGGLGQGAEMKIARSTVSGNSGGATSFGGGILVDRGVYGSFDVVDSTVSGNSATTGGGVSLGSNDNLSVIGDNRDGTTGSIDFANSTIAANSATANGGGIYLSQYDSGSPPVKKSGSASLTSTIVAGNTANGAAQDLDRADASTGGGFDGAFSLVQAPGDAPLAQQSVLVGVDPQLSGLADHGGPTATMLPAGTSPVIDQGRSPARLNVDQRNLTRVVDTAILNPPNGGDGTDIGAVELAADQVVLPPPPPKATFEVTVRGKSISPGTPLLPASLLPFDCKMTVASMTSCSIELRALKSAKISRKVTIPKGALLAEGVATSSGGTSQLSVKVRVTRDGRDVLKAKPVGVDTVVAAEGATDTTSALTQKGVVHLLGGPAVTLGLGKRKAKLAGTVNKRLDELAKLIPDAKTVSCTAYSDKTRSGDVALTKKQAKAACARLVKDGIKAKITVSGKGHAKPIASNKTKRGRALNRRVVVKFTL